MLPSSVTQGARRVGHGGIDSSEAVPLGPSDTRRSSDADFDAAYRRLHPQLLAIAFRHVRHQQSAEDLLQAAAYRAFLRWRSARRIKNLDAYITTCVVNACTDHHRSSRRQRRALERFAASQEWFADAAHAPVFARDERELVDAAFAKLEPMCQEILRLRVVAGVPVSEVAERLTI